MRCRYRKLNVHAAASLSPAFSQELVNNQQVTYQFPYMPTEFPVGRGLQYRIGCSQHITASLIADVPILLTSTSKPLIKTDVSVPLSYDARERLRLQLPTAADEELPAVCCRPH